MSDNKTKPTNESVEAFIHNIEPEKRRSDSRAMLEIMRAATGAEPVLWGNIVGFGKYHYKYESGREGDIMAVGFAPRKAALTLYGVLYHEQNADRIAELGGVTTGKGCIYINDLDAVNVPVLRDLITAAYTQNNNA